ncbi:hypothetical protein GCM10010214_57430 [Streptomyces abikoensis]|nr:hypothetical protein GCM10010214_57430 [Streptomyces abikoensis]
MIPEQRAAGSIQRTPHEGADAWSDPARGIPCRDQLAITQGDIMLLVVTQPLALAVAGLVALLSPMAGFIASALGK